MLGFSLPAYSQAAKVVVPAVGTFDDPASRFATNATNKRRLAPAANVRLHTALTCLLLAIVVVVALVQADVLTKWATILAAVAVRAERIKHRVLPGRVR